jgi:hypothetical protein
MENNEFFYKNSLNTFVSQISILSYFNRKQQYFPSNHIIKQVKQGRLARIQMLQDLISNCQGIDDKVSDSFFKSLEIVKYLEGPQSIKVPMLITKEKLETELNKLITFLKEEIKLWLVNFVNDNEDHLALVQKFHSKFKLMEDEIFSLQVKKVITVPLMKDYIQERLKRSLKKITNLD